MLTVAPHPLLELRALCANHPTALGSAPPTEWLTALLAINAATPFSTPDDALRGAVRDLLRHGGYKPTGRGKPASEYLVRAATEGTLGSINPVVDAVNAVSLHSGFPLSVVDLDKTEAPLAVEIAPAGSSYVFNASGQIIDVSGLLCLRDAVGPCANAVKDSQRTKTSAATTRTLTVIWGTKAHAARVDQAAAWLRELFERLGARVDVVT